MYSSSMCSITVLSSFLNFNRQTFTVSDDGDSALPVGAIKRNVAEPFQSFFVRMAVGVARAGGD